MVRPYLSGSASQAMLETVSKGFKNAKAALTGKTVLTEDNIAEAMREIRVSLLEADVELHVVKTFLERVKGRVLGEVVTTQTQKNGKKLHSSPGEHFVYICHHELERLMGPVEEAPIVFRRPITTIMMVGLQGSGKTTTTGKLASYLVSKKRKPLLVAADIYRPAAVDQLKVLGERLKVPVYAMPNTAPEVLCENSLAEAKKRGCDVVIFDTAGRLAIDDALMVELENIKARTKPDNIFLVCDAMAGQDTVRTAGEFNRRIGISGFIMTKLDGDARGGAALSIKEVTGKPIKFLGMGEELGALEAFRPEGLASRILGMGDIVGLMKDFESVVDEKEAERDAKKMLRGQFTFDDFLKQLSMLQKMGSVKDLYEKMPLFGDAGLPEGVSLDDNTFVVFKSMIQSMTAQERQKPSLLNEARMARIAKGSGRTQEQVADLVNRFYMMQNMMSQLVAQPGLLGMLPGIKQLAGLRKMKGMGMDDIMGGLAPSMRQMAKGMPVGNMALPKGPAPSYQDMAHMLPAGVTEQQYHQALAAMQSRGGMGAMPGMMGAGAGMASAKPVNAKDKQKAKDKRKAEKKARKKSRNR
jgi:signal recognition particle subunit SRP54